MNFIFVSPHFPKTYWNFCDRLHRNGVNVLGIGDAAGIFPIDSNTCDYDAAMMASFDELLAIMAAS